MRKLVWASLSRLPPLGMRLGLTLASLALGALNLVFLTELWPHTPAAKTWLLALEWLALLTLPPQFIGWARRWVRAYTATGWRWLLALVGFWSVACLGVISWVVLLLAGVGAWLWTQ
jgi:hypothetical protein